MNPIESSERHVEVPGGTVFVKEWFPQEVGSKSPIVLLHDSLGCVAMWRDFPEALASKTKRIVFAYDRLGFGLSLSTP